MLGTLDAVPPVARGMALSTCRIDVSHGVVDAVERTTLTQHEAIRIPQLAARLWGGNFHPIVLQRSIKSPYNFILLY